MIWQQLYDETLGAVPSDVVNQVTKISRSVVHDVALWKMRQSPVQSAPAPSGTGKSPAVPR